MTRESDLAYEVTSTFLDKYGPRSELDHSGEDARWYDGSLYSAVSATAHIDALVANGGWPSVYYNGGSRFVPIARSFLNDLGAVGLASACDAAIELGRRAHARLHEGREPSALWLEQSLCEHTTDAEWDLPDKTWKKHAETEDWWRWAAKRVMKAHPEIIEHMTKRTRRTVDKDSPEPPSADNAPTLWHKE